MAITLAAAGIGAPASFASPPPPPTTTSTQSRPDTQSPTDTESRTDEDAENVSEQQDADSTTTQADSDSEKTPTEKEPGQKESSEKESDGAEATEKDSGENGTGKGKADEESSTSDSTTSGDGTPSSAADAQAPADEPASADAEQTGAEKSDERTEAEGPDEQTEAKDSKETDRPEAEQPGADQTEAESTETNPTGTTPTEARSTGAGSAADEEHTDTTSTRPERAKTESDEAEPTKSRLDKTGAAKKEPEERVEASAQMPASRATGWARSLLQQTLQSATLTASFDPSTIAVGETSTLTLTITAPETVNGGGIPGGDPNGPALVAAQNEVNGIGLVLPVPSGLGITNAIPVGCGAPDVGDGSILEMTNATVTGGTCTLTGTVEATAPVTWTLDSDADFTTLTGVDYQGTATLTVEEAATPTLTPSFDPLTINVGETSVLTLAVTPAEGTSANGVEAFSSIQSEVQNEANGLGFTLNLPPGLRMLDTANFECSTITPSSDNTAITVTNINVGGGTCPIGVQFQGDVAGTYTIDSADFSNVNGVQIQGSATLTVLARPTPTVSFTPASVGVGETSTLRIQMVRPQSGVPVNNLYTDLTWNSMNLTISGAATNTCGGSLTAPIGANNLWFSNGGLGADATSCEITVPVKATSPGVYQTTWTMVDLNITWPALTVTAEPAELTASFSESTIRVGESTTLTLTLTRPVNAVGTLSGVDLTVTLPAGLSFSPVHQGCGPVTVGSDGRAITLTDASIADGQCQIWGQVTAIGPGTYTLTGSDVTGLTNVTSALPNEGVTLTVESNATLTAAFNPTSVSVGQQSVLTVTLTRPQQSQVVHEQLVSPASLNSGSSQPTQDTQPIQPALTGLAFELALPAGLTVPANGTATTTCGIGTASVSSGGTQNQEFSTSLIRTQNGDGGGITPLFLRLSQGEISASQDSCTVTVPLVASAAGTYSIAAWNLGETTGIVNGLGPNGGQPTLTVTTQAQTITFPQPTGVSLAAGTVTLTATASSGQPVTYASTTPTVCTVSGATVTLRAAGLCTITASQAGGQQYTAATPVSRSFTVPPLVVAPGAPTITRAEAGNRTITVTWTPGSAGSGSLTGFTATANPGGVQCTAVATGTSCPLTGLTNGTQYTITVVAQSTAGNSPPSAPATATPEAPETAPGTPTSVTATGGVSSITVSWNPPAETETPVTGYVATANPGPATCSTTGATSCVLGAVAGTSYTVTVVAQSAAGDSPPGGPSNAVTPTAPETPAAPPPPSEETTLTTDQGPISTAVPGQELVVVGTGFAPFSTVTITIYTEPSLLATVVTDAYGNFRQPVRIPPGLRVGSHTFLATGVDPDGDQHSLTLAVAVSEATTPPTTGTPPQGGTTPVTKPVAGGRPADDRRPAGPTLPATGSEPLGTALTGFGLLALGVLLVSGRRPFRPRRLRG